MKLSQAAADYEQAYLEAIRRLRVEKPEEAWSGYLDADTLDAARRFTASEEWEGTLALLLSLALPPGRSVLEIGAGNGITSYAFSSAGYDVHSLEPCRGDDYGAPAIKDLVAETGRSVGVVCGTGERLPFKDGMFDLVYLRQCLHHSADLFGLLREAARVLAPGGLFLAAREHVVSDEAELKAFLASHPMQALCGDEGAHKAEDYLAAMRDAGLQVVRIIRPYDSPINLYPDSWTAVVDRAEKRLKRVLGCRLASAVLREPFFQHLLRIGLNRFRKRPGRLYTFVGRKRIRSGTRLAGWKTKNPASNRDGDT